jgi:hypothetical protein
MKACGTTYEVWCNGAKWSSTHPLRTALKLVGHLADRDVLDDKRAEWTIRLVRVPSIAELQRKK